jgi:F-type H+-transporting ATPase subunit b
LILTSTLRRALPLLFLAVWVFATAERRSVASTLVAGAGEAPSAQNQETQKEGPGELFKVINFVILAGILGFLLRKPLKDFFAQRSATLKRELEEGRKALEASQAQMRAVEEKLRHLEEEIRALGASATQEIDSERQRLRQEAAREAERILESARVRLAAETRSVQLELKAFAAQEALRMAERMLRERLDDAARRELFRQFMTNLEALERRN